MRGIAYAHVGGKPRHATYAIRPRTVPRPPAILGVIVALLKHSFVTGAIIGEARRSSPPTYSPCPDRSNRDPRAPASRSTPSWPFPNSHRATHGGKGRARGKKGQGRCGCFKVPTRSSVVPVYSSSITITRKGGHMSLRGRFSEPTNHE